MFYGVGVALKSSDPFKEREIFLNMNRRDSHGSRHNHIIPVRKMLIRGNDINPTRSRCCIIGVDERSEQGVNEKQYGYEKDCRDNSPLIMANREII